MLYRRTHQTGGSYFFTLVTNKRRKTLSGETTVEVLRKAFCQVKINRPFSIDAIVVLPDHIHCIWTLPADDQDFSTRWRLIKTWFTKHYSENLNDCADGLSAGQSQQQVWQNRFWEHLLRDEEDYRRHVEYIHYNPVKHGYVTRPFDWPYSSFQRYVSKGIYPEDWGSSEIILPEGIGNE
jgi:putative transposase